MATEQITLPKKTALGINNVSLSFGGVIALLDIDICVRENELLAIIGPNGSGKTSLLNCISGYYRPQKGEISMDGNQLSKLPPYRIASLGVGRTFQNLELFTGLTTLDNLLAARHLFLKKGLWAGPLYFGPAHDEEIKNRRVVEEIIEFLEIAPIRKKVVGTLPYGMRKRIELGRALALEPKVLLLDEPMAGMNVEEKEDMARFVLDVYQGAEFGYESKFLREGIKTIILVEHDMGVVMDIAERIVTLDFGRKIAEGSPEEIKVNELVIKAYLGEEI